MAPEHGPWIAGLHLPFPVVDARCSGWSGVVVVAVVVTAPDEEAFYDAFEAGHALGQGLDVLAKIRQLRL